MAFCHSKLYLSLKYLCLHLSFIFQSPDSQKCALSNLHIVPVQSAFDAGVWVILVANSQSAHAALVRLNVSATATSLAAATVEANVAISFKGGQCFYFILVSIIIFFFFY